VLPVKGLVLPCKRIGAPRFLIRPDFRVLDGKAPLDGTAMRVILQYPSGYRPYGLYTNGIGHALKKIRQTMRILTTVIFGLIGLATFGQAQTSTTDRFIEVTGDGEVKVDPNIIYLSIDLREYKKDGKIIKLEDLESQLTKVLQTIGIPTDNLKVYASSGRQFDLKKRKADLLIGKRYNLKLTDIDLLNPLLGELGEANIFAVSITEVTHTDIEKFKIEAKIKAINNAKEKAVLLTTTLDSKLGQVLHIREMELVDTYPLETFQVRGLQMRGASSYGYDKVQTNTVDFEQIKLTYKIVVKFKIE